MQFVLQSVAREILGEGWRVSRCRRELIPGVATGPEVVYSERRRRSRYRLLQICASRWVCPVCTPNILGHLREDIALGLAGTTYRLFLVTATIQHHEGVPLASLLRDLNAAWRAARSGISSAHRTRALLRSDAHVGMITALEIRYGRNGWHPHKHALYITERDIDPADLKRAYGGYVRYLERAGYQVNERTLDVRQVRVSDYLTKMAVELTLGPAKKGREVESLSPFQMLDAIRQGEERYRRLFVEYAKATRGKGLLRFSRGLREKLGLREFDEFEAAADVRPDDYLLARLSRWEWSLILRGELRGQLLEAANSGDPRRVEDFLRWVREGRWE